MADDQGPPVDIAAETPPVTAMPAPPAAYVQLGYVFAAVGAILFSTKAVAITVTNVNEAPSITSGTTGTEAENTAISNVVYKATATDPDANTTLTYSLSGADAGQFNINSSTGEVTFKSSPDYEHPTDAGGDNHYNITVTASDGSLVVISTRTLPGVQPARAPC